MLRFNYAKAAPGVYDAMDALDQYLAGCGLEEWAEAVTLVAGDHVPDAVYDVVRPHFSDTDLSNLTLAVATINAWNRLSIAARLTPGAIQPIQGVK